MKILHLLQSNKFSGAENVVCEIVKMMSDNPEIEMVYCSRDGQIRTALKERGIKFVPIEKLSVSEVKRVIGEQKPDLIHAHDRSACVFAALACNNIPIVAHMHVNNHNRGGTFIKNFLWTVVSYKYRHVFFVSDSSYDEFPFKYFVRKKSSVLYNIIDIDALRKRAEEDKEFYDYDVVYVGRLTYQKNPERLMKVMNRIVQLDSSIKIAVVGDGDLSDYVKGYISENRLDKNIYYLGFINNPIKLIANSKVLLMTSRFEGTPMTVLEAQCMGVPIVSTPVDGLLKVVEHGVNGFLDDDDEELAKYVTEIAGNKDLFEKMKSKSLSKAKVYNDLEVFRREIEKEYFS